MWFFSNEFVRFATIGVLTVTLTAGPVWGARAAKRDANMTRVPLTKC